MRLINKGEIAANCYMVQRGKPAATITLQDRYLETAKDFITNEFGLNSYCEKISDGWNVLWIYKYPHIFEVIKSLPQVPKKTFDHWVLGKLFGYEEASIQDFLLKHG